MKWREAIIPEIEGAISDRFEFVQVQLRYNKTRVKVFIKRVPPKQITECEEETIVE